MNQKNKGKAAMRQKSVLKSRRWWDGDGFPTTNANGDSRIDAITAAVSTEAGQNQYLGEHLIAPSNFGDPDWGLYTGDGTASEALVGGIQVGDAAANALRGSGAGEYFFGGEGGCSCVRGEKDDESALAIR